MRLSNQGYDNLKRFATVVFPAIITSYIAVAGYWHLHYTGQIVGTATAINVLLGVVLSSLSSKYAAVEAAKKGEATEYDGDIHFVKFEGQDAHLVLHVSNQEQVENFAGRQELTFKVVVGQS